MDAAICTPSLYDDFDASFCMIHNFDQNYVPGRARGRFSRCRRAIDLNGWNYIWVNHKFKKDHTRILPDLYSVRVTAATQAGSVRLGR